MKTYTEHDVKNHYVPREIYDNAVGKIGTMDEEISELKEQVADDTDDFIRYEQRCLNAEHTQQELLESRNQWCKKALSYQRGAEHWFTEAQKWRCSYSHALKNGTSAIKALCEWRDEAKASQLHILKLKADVEKYQTYWTDDLAKKLKAQESNRELKAEITSLENLNMELEADLQQAHILITSYHHLPGSLA